MNIKDILAFSNTAPDFENEIHSFLSFCEHLDTLTKAENDALLSENGIRDRQSAYTKVVLLEQFEDRASKIFTRVKEEAPHNLALQTHLVDCVRAFQEKLKINTGLHLHIMRTSPCYGGGDPVLCH